MRNGYDIAGVDEDPHAVAAMRDLAARLAPKLPVSNFLCLLLERMMLPEATADVVISNAVLHFAEDDAEFEGMLRGSWRILKPGGLSFAALLRRSEWCS